MDASGNFKTHKVKSRDLSASWVWENSIDGGDAQPKVVEVLLFLKGKMYSFLMLHFLV